MYFNDENVYKVTPDLVKKLAFESNTKCASMVFYIQHEAIYEIGKYISIVFNNWVQSMHEELSNKQDLELNESLNLESNMEIEQIEYFSNMGFPRDQIIHIIKTMPEKSNAENLNLLFKKK